MIETIQLQLTDDHKTFLLSFKSGEPEWDQLKHSHAQELPAVRWKLKNIRRLGSAQRKAALVRLEELLTN